MASSTTTQRAVCAGLSCGIGLGLPAVACAVSLPLDAGVNEQFVAAALPFAAGSLAGVGLLALTQTLAEKRSDRKGDVSDAHDSKTSAGRVSSPFASHGGLFGHSANDGVPVISRAQNGISEQEAWAMIDELCEEDSLFSCDPARANDVYQVAIDELTQAADKSTSFNREDIAAAARAAAGSNAVPAGTTAQFIAMASAVSATGDFAGVQTDDVPNADPARAAALASLDVPHDSFVASKGSSFASYDFEDAGQVASAPPQAAMFVDSKDSMGPRGDQSVSFAAAQTPAYASASLIDSLDEPEEVEVPMADYSGHEDMWASALAILAEEDSIGAVSVSVPSVQEPVQETFLGGHSRVAAASDTCPMESLLDAAPAGGVDQGAQATQMDDHVNNLVQDEMAQASSARARIRSREYLKVIQGGTMSMPRLQAEG